MPIPEQSSISASSTVIRRTVRKRYIPYATAICTYIQYMATVLDTYVWLHIIYYMLYRVHLCTLIIMDWAYTRVCTRKRATSPPASLSNIRWIRENTQRFAVCTCVAVGAQIVGAHPVFDCVLMLFTQPHLCESHTQTHHPPTYSQTIHKQYICMSDLNKSMAWQRDQRQLHNHYTPRIVYALCI